MKTQQADSRGNSVGRDAALRRPRTAIWLNLVCLDAPLVAIAWLWLFAHTFAVPLQGGNAIALFLTSWLIYLGDRVVDAIFLEPGVPQSARQRFCLRHREIWIAIVVLVAGFDAYVIWHNAAPATWLAGTLVGGLALVYLVVNHPVGSIWRSLPAKELAIGVLFAAGTLVALMPRVPAITLPYVLAGFAFASLCVLNCISIAGWERTLDRAQGKVSLATRHPGIVRHVGKISGILASLALGLAFRFPSATGIFVCLGSSSLLLTWLNASPRFLNTDQRTALADLVLLTPIVPFLLKAL